MIDGENHFITGNVHQFDLIMVFFFWGGGFFLGPHLMHMEVSRLGVESELQLPAYITTTATWDPRLWPTPQLMATHGILNPLSEARD